MGTLPPEMGLLTSLSIVDLRNNFLNCAPSLNSSMNGSSVIQCSSQQVLPCFLNLTQELFPRADDSKMECPRVVRKPYSQAVKDCKGSGAAQLVSHVPLWGCACQNPRLTWTLDIPEP